VTQPPRTPAAAFRSILDATHAAESARWELVNDTPCVSTYGETAAERLEAFTRLALLDLSPLPRFGLKGGNTQAWFTSRNVRVGDLPNRAYPQLDGSLVARLSARECLILADPLKPDLSADHDYFTPGRDCYPIRRQDTHYWFALTGDRAPPTLAKLCGVNFDPPDFANHLVAQTLVAGTSVIVVRNDIHPTLCYYLLGDSSCTAFMWACLVDAIREHEGRKLGIQALRQSP
jgi:sarcosine oxidase subunit gamma